MENMAKETEKEPEPVFDDEIITEDYITANVLKCFIDRYVISTIRLPKNKEKPYETVLYSIDTTEVYVLSRLENREEAFAKHLEFVKNFENVDSVNCIGSEGVAPRNNVKLKKHVKAG